MMGVLMMPLLFSVWVELSRCENEVFILKGNIRDFDIASNSVYVVTEERLVHLSLSLTPITSLLQRGISTDSHARFQRTSESSEWNATFIVNTLVPFVMNNTLITCGVIKCGYCEIRDLKNISMLLHSENIRVGSDDTKKTPAAFLVDVETSRLSETYILAVTKRNELKDKCFSDRYTVTLHNTNDDQMGNIFSGGSAKSSNQPFIKTNKDIHFADSFQINLTVYIFFSFPKSIKEGRIRLIWLESKVSKDDTLASWRSAKLNCSFDGRAGQNLLSSSVVPGGPPVLWAGVFSSPDPTDTALFIFDISPDQSHETNPPDPDFCGLHNTKSFKILEPKTMLFQYSSMTSVLAVQHKSWMVFFIGTADGQVIKLAVDKSYRTICRKVLYKSDDDRQVFYKMNLDTVDHKHLIVALGNQLRRIPVSQCKTYTDLQGCWSAQDPYCGWCDTTKSCIFEEECPDSLWLSIPEDASQQNMLSHHLEEGSNEKITLTIKTHVVLGGTKALNHFTCQVSESTGNLCNLDSPPPKFPGCTCIFNSSRLSAQGLDITAKITLGGINLIEQRKLTNCSNIIGTPTSVLCHECVTAGCGWVSNRCSWTHADNIKNPEIYTITPTNLSFYGSNHAMLTGNNLTHVTKVRIKGNMDCMPKESPVWNNTDVKLMFHIPAGDKGQANICLVLPDDSCHGSATVFYRSVPSCTMIMPNSSWTSGKRKLTVHGSNLEFVDGFIHNHKPQMMSIAPTTGSRTISYDSPSAEDPHKTFNSTMSMKVANHTILCPHRITYYPDPEFTSFSFTRTGDDLRITIQKKVDKFNMTIAELSVWGVQENKPYECIMRTIATSNETDSIICEIQRPIPRIQSLKIQFGNMTITLHTSKKSLPSNLWILSILVFLLLPCIIVAVWCMYRKKQKSLTDQVNKHLEDLELSIRNDIRQGFVDLQTEKADLLENVGAIPFLDYKHFASRIFFPEGGTLIASCIRDIGQVVAVVEPEECCQALSRLIRDQLFLTSVVHALEEQKSFTVKDKCTVASLLTIALHGDLVYLTQVMEVLLRDLMRQPSNAQPKLLLRRTESIVEKLLTNWMSICLYGFLRESVGQHLFCMVSALVQQIARGPVDSVTEKALYTLSEDWLLWQTQDFASLKVKVLFAVGTTGEVSEPLEVSLLSCDTVDQVKQKILTTFKTKFGFPFSNLKDIHIEYDRDGIFVPLEEVDDSSEVMGKVTMLNTLKHYKVPDGASIKVLSRKSHPPLSPQGSLKDDQDFSVKYFHLIDPDVDFDQSPEKKKFKLKEVHLTKLLSTKVAVHSFVENLFRAIWGRNYCRAPPAIKHFFDFLDAQADSMNITDPDVLHIWKTNSLPLRFWVNILKNPQFVFDIEKTPHLDGCLSVITQAFMDTFSLSETQLGKYAPTNKLLYAKDIPQFKQEVKAYYKQVRDQPPMTSSEFKDFLLDESRKHENEFNESAALRELYKFIERYYVEIAQKLEHNCSPAELTDALQHVKSLFDGLKSCSWN